MDALHDTIGQESGMDDDVDGAPLQGGTDVTAADFNSRFSDGHTIAVRTNPDADEKFFVVRGPAAETGGKTVGSEHSWGGPRYYPRRLEVPLQAAGQDSVLDERLLLEESGAGYDKEWPNWSVRHATQEEFHRAHTDTVARAAAAREKYARRDAAMDKAETEVDGLLRRIAAEADGLYPEELFRVVAERRGFMLQRR